MTRTLLLIALALIWGASVWGLRLFVRHFSLRASYALWVSALAFFWATVWILALSGLELLLEQEAGGPRELPFLLRLLFLAPLAEGLTALTVWPLYLKRRLSSARLGALYSCLGAAVFSLTRATGWLLLEADQPPLLALRLGLALPAGVFTAALWGASLGSESKDRHFAWIWVGLALLHGLYDELVFKHGPAYLVLCLPLLGFMALALRRVFQEAKQPEERLSTFGQFELTTRASLKEAWTRPERPLLLHWILFGALVNLGVILVFCIGAVLLGHRMGVDFSLAEESSARAVLPIAVLALALMAAFPFAAYWVARASRAESVLEPAWSSGLSILILLGLFSVMEPEAVLIGLGTAPVGFSLACFGAWLGLEREDEGPHSRA